VALFILGERKNVAAIQSVAELRPALSTITSDEDPTEFLVIDHAGVKNAGVLVVGKQSTHLAVSEAFVRCGERCRVVGAEQYAASIRSEHHSSGITRIDHLIVHDDVRSRYAM